MNMNQLSPEERIERQRSRKLAQKSTQEGKALGCMIEIISIAIIIAIVISEENIYIKTCYILMTCFIAFNIEYRREAIAAFLLKNNESQQLIKWYKENSFPVLINSGRGQAKGIFLEGCFFEDNDDNPIFTVHDLMSAEVIAEQDAKSFVKKVGWGTAAYIGLGTMFSGGLGVLGAGAALLTAGNSKQVVFLVTLKQGEQFIVKSSDEAYIKIKTMMV
jgi:hypothetical protein